MSDQLRKPAAPPRQGLAPVVSRYNKLHDETAGGTVDARNAQRMEMVNDYYDLITDFYECGWGDSFHYAPRKRGESYRDSIVRHQVFLANAIGLQPGMRALDVGCGVGGPLRTIARASGAFVVGLNNHAYQLEKCKAYNLEAGLQHQAELLKGDFMNIPAEAESFDAAYEIEATAHTADKAGVFSEIARVLKPGGLFGGYEWCMTSRYDPDNAEHRALKKGIERGNAVPDVAAPATVLAGLEAAGFEVVEARDLAPESDPETPWHSILDQREVKPVSSPETTGGRRVAAMLAQVRQGLAFVPKGTSEVMALVECLVDSTRDAGRLGIFTPLFYFKARKPA